jgi:hypothetical protein
MAYEMSRTAPVDVERTREQEMAYIRLLEAETRLLNAEASKLVAETHLILATRQLERAKEEARKRAKAPRPWWKLR